MMPTTVELRERSPVEHCELCGLFHDAEGEYCPVGGKGPLETHMHCACWWDGDGCCRCGSDPCRAAMCRTG